jgi:hypothetical protein
MGYQTKSIREAVQLISQGKMFLPEIQRKFVWKESQIEGLFDSIILGYPIGTFLFWKVTQDAIVSQDMNLYEFIRDFHERDNYQNIKAPNPPVNNYEFYYVVLDGQQRLSSLYIALQGSIAMKKPKAWKKADRSFPVKELYFNLDSSLEAKGIDDEVVRFKFYASAPSEGHWYRVKDILAFADVMKVVHYASDHSFSDSQANNLMALFAKINGVNDATGNSVINFYEIDEQDYDDVLNIFVRVNSSGTPLSKSDLLFSTMVANWKGARGKIDTFLKELNKQGEGFSFDIDFVMRASLALVDAPASLKIQNFKTETISRIETNWPIISQALEDLVSFLVKFGFSDQYISSYNALIPIAYYLSKGGSLKGNEMGFRRYLFVAQIKNIFGVASNAAIDATRGALKGIDPQNTPFSLSLFKNIHLVGDRDFSLNETLVDRCFEDFNLGRETFMVLSLLYPELKLDQVQWHQDHVHPFAGFDTKKISKLISDKDQIQRWQEMRNKLPNLELLEGKENESKNDSTLVEWLRKGNKVKYLPEGIDYSVTNFEEFYEKRKSLMATALKSALGME